jgi:hypothetical protein
MLPFVSVEHEGFRYFVRKLAPSAHFPLRQTITRAGERVFKETIRPAVTAYLKSAPTKISITTDGWTSRAEDSYIGITAHWITPQWQMASVSLAVREILGIYSKF